VLGLAGAAAKAVAPAGAERHRERLHDADPRVPDLVLMLLVFYGGQVLVNQLAQTLGRDSYIDVDPYRPPCVLTIGLHLRCVS